MRIAFLGNFGCDFSSETHHAKTLESLGHEIIRIQEPAAGDDILKVALNCDLFIWIHTHGWDNTGKPMKEVLKELRKQKIKSITYHLDLWMGLERQKDMMKDDYWHIDYFFTVDKLMADWLNKNTKVKGVFLPAGVYDKECYIASKGDWNQDIVFTGSYSYHPEHQWRREMIDWLYKTYGNRFKRYGNPAPDNPNAYPLRGKPLNEMYAKTKIVIGDTLCKGFDYPYYFSDRIFETTGRGGFIIHPYIQGIRKYFTNKEVPTYKFGDYKDLKEKIDYYLENFIEREQMRFKAHNRTKKDHTYINRWKTILNELKR
jgi:hypothetical protein